jgi:hypothetical protein
MKKEKGKRKKLMSLHEAMAMGGLRMLNDNGLLGGIDYQKEQKEQTKTTQKKVDKH